MADEGPQHTLMLQVPFLLLTVVEEVEHISDRSVNNIHGWVLDRTKEHQWKRC